MKKIALLLILISMGSLLMAQESENKAGAVGFLVAINANTDATIGLNWFLSKQFVLRPAVTFKIIGVSSTLPTVTSTSSSSIGVSLGGFYEIVASPGFLIGVGAILDLTFNNSNTTYNATNIAGAGTIDDLITSFGASVVADFQYIFNKNFAVFADIGLGFSTSSPSNKVNLPGNNVTTTGATTTSFGFSRSALGVIFYF